MKEALRKQFMLKRKAFSQKEILAKSSKIEEKLFSFKPFSDSKSVMFFVSFGKEPFTHGMIKRALADKTVVIPKIFGDNLLPCRISSCKGFARGPYGVPEPVEENFFSPLKIDFVLVPGLAFAKNGGRLGYGKGYFDRFLKKSRAFKVGVCFDEFIVSELPVESHDINVNAIITDERIIPIGKKFPHAAGL